MSGPAGIERDSGDEGARHTRLKEFPANLITVFRVVSSELNAVVRNPCTAHPLLEEPFHGAPAFEVHAGRHDGFYFVPQIIRGEGTVSVLGHQRLQ